MARDRTLHRFSAPIEEHDIGCAYNYTVVYMPADLKEKLPLKKYPRLRVQGRIEGVAFEAAWEPVHGEWYLMVPKRMMKKTDVVVGSKVQVEFRISDQDHVDIPGALLEALARNQEAGEIWKTMTPGKQRGLAHRVASAKTATTRRRGVLEVLATITDG